MSIDEKFATVSAIISEHNDVIGDSSKPGWVDLEVFVSRIKSCGGTSEDRLKKLRYEDIIPCLITEISGEGQLAPTALAREIASIFRGSDSEEPEAGRPKTISTRRAERLTPEELVKAFDPEEPTNAVGRRLESISHGRRFVVFAMPPRSSREVNIRATTRLLLEVKQGFPERSSYRSGVDTANEVVPVYRVGELPPIYVDENPLYPGRVLRPDGTCDQTGRSWDGVPLKVRQLVRLAIDEGELKVDIDAAHRVIDMAVRTDAESVIKERYQHAALRYIEFAAQDGRLPSLRIPMTVKPGSRQEPLQGGKKVIFG